MAPYAANFGDPEMVDPEVRRKRMRRIAALVVLVWVVVALLAATRVHNPDPEYAFLDVLADGTPVAYPCGPIGVVVDSDGGPDDWRAQVDEALDAVGVASEYELVDLSDAPASEQVEPLIRIRWSDAAADRSLAGSVVGRAGSYVDVGDSRHYAGGRVVLDTQGSGTYAAEDRQATLQHELGHVLGLDHVGSPYELMATGQERQTSQFGPGDRLGLTALQEASCPGSG